MVWRRNHAGAGRWPVAAGMFRLVPGGNMKLWIGNLNPAVSDEDLRAFIAKYCAAEAGSIEREPGDGSRPAAIVDFPELGSTALHTFQSRLHGMYWQDRTINVQVM